MMYEVLNFLMVILVARQGDIILPVFRNRPQYLLEFILGLDFLFGVHDVLGNDIHEAVGINNDPPLSFNFVP